MHRGKTFNQAADNYRAHVKDRVPALLDKLDFDRAQIIKDRFPNRKLNAVTPAVDIPRTLSWS